MAFICKNILHSFDHHKPVLNMLKTNLKRALVEKFHKRKCSCLKKAHKLRQLCQAEVYVAIYHNSRWYTYTSFRKSQWPSSDSEIVRLKYQDLRIYMLMCINRKGTFHYWNTSILLISRQRTTLLTKSWMFWSRRM